MNHPKREEWVPYLFGEANSGISRQLKAHLQDCPECREEIDGWKNSLGHLDDWKLAPVVAARQTFQPFLKWAAAAAIVLGVGFGIGRLTSASANVETVRAAIEPGIRQQLRQELADYTRASELRRTEDIQAIYAALDKLDSQRLADTLSLKKELDIVAVNTDAGLRHTEQQLVQLADYTQPATFSTSPKE